VQGECGREADKPNGTHREKGEERELAREPIERVERVERVLFFPHQHLRHPIDSRENIFVKDRDKKKNAEEKVESVQEKDRKEESFHVCSSSSISLSFQISFVFFRTPAVSPPSHSKHQQYPYLTAWTRRRTGGERGEKTPRSKG
jgi:hypothetical protein